MADRLSGCVVLSTSVAWTCGRRSLLKKADVGDVETQPFKARSQYGVERDGKRAVVYACGGTRADAREIAALLPLGDRIIDRPEDC